MIIFYDPNNGNQVMAVYSHDTKSTVWADNGLLRAKVVVKQLQRLIDRNMSVVVLDGEVQSLFVRLNSKQPTPMIGEVRLKELHTAVRTRDLSVQELNELARLERGL